ncbi:MAG: Mur ligase [Ahrensia sp.]|nr:Mur ligase [Ahrensia sp.]|tara:strand:- start:2869 stop:4215 length:1347 start_codon:yes stop_codon:yes gene_type:complete
MSIVGKLLGKTGSLRSLTRPFRKKARHLVRFRLARMKRARIGAEIVAITGSSGKSTATRLISRFLQTRFATREQAYQNTISACTQAILDATPTDEYLVIETGASVPGSVVEMAGLMKPKVAVVTMVNVEHRSAFKTIENVTKEKGALVEAVAEGGFAVLNADDENAIAMAERTKQRIVTFGHVNDADYRVVELGLGDSGTMELAIRSAHGTHRLSTKLMGIHFWPSVAAAFAVAVENGIAPETIAETLKDIETGYNRCQPYEIENGPTFIIDTVKAPLATLPKAFEVIRPLRAPRKRIVLGMLADHPGDSNTAYKKAYRWAAEVADQVIFVGEHAHRHKASAEEIANGRIVEMTTTEQAYAFLRDTALPGEIIFLKSAGVAHLERLALGFDHDVRCWKERCRVPETCQACGLYEYPYERHPQVRRQKKLARWGMRKAATSRESKSRPE